MGKSTKKKNKKITAPKANIQELSISRDGGQIALRGYSCLLYTSDAADE